MNDIFRETGQGRRRRRMVDVADRRRIYHPAMGHLPRRHVGSTCVAPGNVGTGLDWAFVQPVWFWAIAVLKFSLWLMALVVIWLTLWARQLRKQANMEMLAEPDRLWRVLQPMIRGQGKHLSVTIIPIHNTGTLELYGSPPYYGNSVVFDLFL